MPSKISSSLPFLSINDPVTISFPGESAQPLQGIIAHTGPVHFSQNTDLIGVRLAGSSSGKGEHNGSLHGHEYFSGSLCGPKDGIFVKSSQITPRVLNKLEALKHRRELAGATRDSKSRLAKLREEREIRSRGNLTLVTPIDIGAEIAVRNMPYSDEASILSTISNSTQGNNRLEELRERRFLKIETSPSLPLSLVSKTPDIWMSRNRSPAHHNIDVSRRPSFPPCVEEEVTLSPSLASNAHQSARHLTLPQRRFRYKELSENFSKIKQEQFELQKAYEISQNESNKLREDVREYKALAEKAASNFQRVIQEKQKNNTDNDNNNNTTMENQLEYLTLDRDEFSEQNNFLLSRVEELEMDVEICNLEMEELHLDLKQKQENEREIENGTQQNCVDHDDSVIKSLTLQNSNLREAILMLRQQNIILVSQQSNSNIWNLKPSDNGINDLKTRNVSSFQSKQIASQLKEENRQLKEMIDVNHESSHTIERLSDTIHNLQIKNSMLTDRLMDLEEGMYISEELEELYSEELKCANMDLEIVTTQNHNLLKAIHM